MLLSTYMDPVDGALKQSPIEIATKCLSEINASEFVYGPSILLAASVDLHSHIEIDEYLHTSVEINQTHSRRQS